MDISESGIVWEDLPGSYVYKTPKSNAHMADVFTLLVVIGNWKIKY
jgi:hypothetical protein